MEVLAELKKAQQGDEHAFALLFEMFSDRIYRFICYKVSINQEQEDILQEVFFKAWKGLPKLKVEELNFSAWLYKIATNAINDLYRQKYRRPEPLELNEDAAIVFDNPSYDSALA